MGGAAAIDQRKNHALRPGKLERDEPAEEPTPGTPIKGLSFGIPVDRPPRTAMHPIQPWPPSPEPRQDGRRRRAGSGRVLVAAGGLALLLVGFLLGAGLTGDRAAPTGSAPAPTSPSVASTPPASSAPGAGQVPRDCLAAIERADQAISYLVGNIRDRRLSEAMLDFIATKSACLDLATR
jgi:hypothetical protein